MSINKKFDRLWNQGYFTTTNKILLEISEKLRRTWTDLVANHTTPSWWGRMAVFEGSGGGVVF